MTVPYKFAIPLLLAAPLVCWFWGSRKYDFMTPREIPVSELRPEFASPVDREVAALLNERSPEPEQPKAPDLVKLEIGDLQTSPGLDEYRAQAGAGALALLDLAQRLQNSGQVQRAVLAYERIQDSTPAGSSVQKEAEIALGNLKTELPMWHADPDARLPLQIHFDTARPPETLERAIATLTELLTIGSGNLCRPTFHILTSPPPSTPLPSLPAAVWMTIPGEAPDKPSLSVVTVTPQSDKDLDHHLTSALYRLLCRRLRAIGSLTEPAALAVGEDPENAIVNRITRLAWKEILTTPFQSLEAGPPGEVLSEESDGENDERVEEVATEIQESDEESP